MRTSLWVAIVAVGLSVTVAQAVTRYLVMPGTAGVTPTPPYTTWATAGTNAFDMMQQANITQANDVLIISNGVYELPSMCSPGGTGARYEGFTGNPDDVVITPGPGFLTTQPLFYLNGGANNWADNSIWEGLTFSGGVYRAVHDYSGTNVTYRNCVFVDNQVDHYNTGGAAIYAQKGYHLKLFDCVFQNNKLTNSFGKGSAVQAVSVTVSNCTFTGNGVLGTGAYGGALYTTGDSTVYECVFSNNTGQKYGGGGYNTGPLRMQQCTFTSNTADSGGGWCADDPETLIVDCVFSNNVAARGGGLAFAGTGGVVSNCLFVDNSASSGGGVSFGYGNGGLLVNCVLSNNTANVGGGLSTYPGAGEARNCLITANTGTSYAGGIEINSVLGTAYTNHISSCTIVGNHSGGKGGGIYLTSQTYIGYFDVWNSIIYSNTAVTAGTEDLYNNNVVDIAYYYNCTSLTLPSESNITNAPGFHDYAAGNYRLLSTSPCNGAGAVKSWMAGAVDLDGRARVQGVGVEMGAYEIVPPPAGSVVTIQ